MSGTVTYFTDEEQTHQDLVGRTVYAVKKVDFTRKPAVTNDVVQVLNIPAKALVHQVYVRVDTLEGATCTATVGDASGANNWDASTNLNAANNTVTGGLVGTDSYTGSGGKYYSAADTLDLTMANNANNAIITCVAEYCVIP